MKNKELEKLKKQREKLKEDKNKPQKRSIEIIEYEDGSYSIIGYCWDLPLQSDEIKDAFESWIDGSLENGIDPEKLIEKELNSDDG